MPAVVQAAFGYKPRHKLIITEFIKKQNHKMIIDAVDKLVILIDEEIASLQIQRDEAMRKAEQALGAISSLQWTQERIKERFPKV